MGAPPSPGHIASTRESSAHQHLDGPCQSYPVSTLFIYDDIGQAVSEVRSYIKMPKSFLKLPSLVSSYTNWKGLACTIVKHSSHMTRHRLSLNKYQLRFINKPRGIYDARKKPSHYLQTFLMSHIQHPAYASRAFTRTKEQAEVQQERQPRGALRCRHWG